MKWEYNRKYIIIIVSFAALFGCLFLFTSFKSAMISKFMAKAMPLSIQVTAEPVRDMLWSPEIHSVGSAKALQAVDITAEVAGRVTELFFHSGQYVEANTVLIQLNSSVLKADFESARAKYMFSKITYDRQQALYLRDAGQRQSVDSAKSEMDAAQANRDKIKAQLNQLTIKAPFKGVLGLRSVDVGQYVSPGQVLVSLQSTSFMQVEFTVPETLLADLSVGLPVTVSSPAYPNEKIQGKIIALDSKLQATSRALTVRAMIDNEGGRLISGMFLDVTVHLGGGARVIIIPQMALNYSQLGNYVYVIQTGKAIKRYVQAGERREDYIVINSGLTLKDIVITTGQLKLHDGAPVDVKGTSTAVEHA